MNATVIIVQDVACLVFYFCFIYLGTEHWKNNSSEPAFHIIPKKSFIPSKYRVFDADWEITYICMLMKTQTFSRRPYFMVLLEPE